MYSSLLSQLEKILATEQAQLFAGFLEKLTPNTAQNITAHKVSISLGISSKEAFSILLKCFNAGILTIDYGIRCSNCNTLIKRIPSQDTLPDDSLECYSCGENFDVTPDNIEVLYSIGIDNFFPKGQQDEIATSNYPVAPNDSLKDFLTAGFNVNKLLYNPTDAQYDELKGRFNSIFLHQPTAKKAGDALESLVIFLFGLVQSFKVGAIKTKTNQIDCIVRNHLRTPSGFFSFLGERIVIEAKNENKTPSGTYMHKIYGIIRQSNSSKQLVNFGIIVSRKAPPKTYCQIAREFYLRDGIVIVHISEKDLNEIIINRLNLIEMLERKRDEIAFNTTTDLVEANIFTA